MENIFSDKEPVLDLIKRRMCDLKEGYRQNIALVGSLHVGKSTVLQTVLIGFDDPEIVPVYLDLQNRDLDYLVGKTCRSILHHFSRIKGLVLHDDIELLMSSVRDIIPETVEKMSAVFLSLEKGRIDEAFDTILVLLDVFLHESGFWMVLVLDEFQALEDMGVSDVFKKLASRITTQKRSLYILASSFQVRAKKILGEELTLLFGSFEIVNIVSMDVKSSCELLERQMGEIKCGSSLKKFLADFTGGCPLYLDIISRELRALASTFKQQEVYAPLIAQVVANLLFNRWGVLGRHFELTVDSLCSGKNNRLVLSILFSLANGKYKIKEIIAECRARQSQVSQRLNYLIDEGLVEKNGSCFHIKDKLMSYWLRYVFQKRVRYVELESEDREGGFKDDFLALIGDFQSNSRKDFSCRVIELLNCFENDQFHFYGRKYKLPVFKDVRSLEMGDQGRLGFDVIQAEAEDGSWLLVLRKELLVETDIKIVVDETKKMGLRFRKCIIVPLSGIDDTARLCALNEQMWIWNEPVLNSLMSIYGKSYIVP